MSDKSCETCAFWIKPKDTDTERRRKRVGKCRRFPPDNTSGHPQVAASDWCGEYRS